MPNTVPEELFDADADREDLQSANSDNVDSKSLEQAYAFFNDASSQLQNSYHFLEDKVARLTRELSDISAEKEVEQEKNNNLNSRLQSLLEFMPGGIILIDAKGIIIQSNPAAKKMLQHELDGALWRDLINECFDPRDDDGFEVSTRDGRKISIATSSMQDEGQIILLTDQTETRALQTKLSRYEKLSAMGKMVSALAHQIRTPLSAAMLYANHLSKDSLASDKREYISEKLFSRLNHMEKQVRDMLLFVRNELPLTDEINLLDLERGIRAAIEVILGSSGSYCLFINPRPNTRIKCNREALISAVSNLVNNAIQAKKSSSNIAIRFERVKINSRAHLRIAVVDDGPGMTQEKLNAAKDLFFTTKSQGTGLGLAVVQSVARAHGGYFTLQSKKGRGTLASIVLPMMITPGESE